MKRLVAAALLTLVLSACGSSAATSGTPTPVPFIVPAPTAVSETSPIPSTMPSPLAVQLPSPPPAATPAPAARMLSGTFPIVAIGRSNVTGLVQVSQIGDGVVATVSARGLRMGMPTLHTVHIHAGSCANPFAGRHLTVLGTLAANAAGAGSFSAGLAPTYLSNGHYVIIYASLAPQVIVGCANLAPLS